MAGTRFVIGNLTADACGVHLASFRWFDRDSFTTVWLGNASGDGDESTTIEESPAGEDAEADQVVDPDDSPGRDSPEAETDEDSAQGQNVSDRKVDSAEDVWIGRHPDDPTGDVWVGKPPDLEDDEEES